MSDPGSDTPRITSVVVMTSAYAEGKAEAMSAARTVAEGIGCTLTALSPDAERFRESGIEVEVCGPGADPPDVCLVLGGDGTILRALRTYAGTGTPVFAVNFGAIGFLATAERSDLEGALRRAMSGDFDTLALPGLALEVAGESMLALNDVGFSRRPDGPVAALAYSLGGEEVGRVRCDGLVAATPAGSTGYNLANGGPVMAWGVEGFAVSFIAPHTLTARALVVAPSDVLHVKNVGARDSVDVTIDGQKVHELMSDAEVEVRFRDEVATLAQLPGTTFYGRIREKFGLLAR